MPDQISNRDSRPPFLKALDRILRGLLAINFALFVLAFIPAYSGIGQREPGLSDRLFKAHVLYGWSGDVVWMCASTLLIGVASIPIIVVGGVTETKEPPFHRTAILCLMWLACFLVYLVYTVIHMF
ncbi:MAG TPA: hypothetical protein VJO33_13525 [Gemmatimonadaceae bacterium]|nr:hypothetical protein [Gemmatimonadaceae bacterium]